jgi:uncharacterized RDD family membrane protein YckC
LAVVILSSICLTGCLEIEYDLNIRPDSTEDITVKIGMPDALASSAGESVDALEKQGYTVTVKTEGDKYFVIGKATTQKGVWYLPYPEDLLKDKITFEPSFTDYLFFREYSMKARYLLDKRKVNRKYADYPGSPIPIKYVITVPGKIAEHNAHEVSGNTMIWRYVIRPDEKVDMRFSSTEVNYPAILAAWAALLVLVAVAAVVLIRRRDTGASTAGDQAVYAGFWKRVAAFVIDGVVTYIAFFIIGFLYGIGFGFTASMISFPDKDALAAMTSHMIWLSFALSWIYYAAMESSPLQATIGKTALGIKVADLRGNRVSFGKATGRHFGKIVSALTLGVGYIMAAFTARKQALHDIMAGCVVVNR